MLKHLILIIKIFLILITLGIATGGYIIYYYSRDLPDYSQLEKYYPPCVTRIYSADGKLIEEYAREHRVFVPISSVPRSLVEAFIAAEDKNFYYHHGIDISSIIRAAISNISNILRNKRVEGGSTITQQVVKNFLVGPERSLERKIKEAILSYMLSQTFTKEQILELYLNQIFLGKGAHGVAAAALAYFNKSVEELTIAESAVLASLPKAPSAYNPEKNYEKAVARRNYVISRMYEDGYITKEAASEAMGSPIKLAKYDKVRNITADYYAEKVREEVIGMFGAEYFYTAGLTVITCLESEYQKHAAAALKYGIRAYDEKKGYRGSLQKIPLKDWQKELKSIPKPEGLLDYRLAVVLKIESNEAKIGLRDGSAGVIKISDMAWTRTNLKSIKEILSVGDVIAVDKTKNGYVLKQIPAVNGGILVMEPKTGRVLAADGGYDFGVSKFDRTAQANRQPGSLMKLFVYLSALENGIKPNDIFDDAPITIVRGSGLPNWSPKNFERDFLGPITMRKGLEKSRNTVTVRIGQKIGFSKIAETVKRFGINDDPPKVPSMVLGAVETTLLRMTTAYAIIANNGIKVEPQYIELIKDRKGNVIYKRDYAECPECRSYRRNTEGDILPPILTTTTGEAITDEATSYQAISLMMGGIERGTGQGAKKLGKIIAGKTGTTNDSKDTWFIGFTPKILVGTYVGFDTPKDMGKRSTGATVALPIFVNFMQNAYKNEPSLPFKIPDSIKLESIDYDTGKPSTAKGSITEAFKVNNVSPKPAPFVNKTEEPETEIYMLPLEEYDSSEEVY